MTAILKCDCRTGPNGNKNAAIQQDALYGSGNRVHNKTAKQPDETYRCSVCGHERAKKTAAPAAKKKE